SDPNSDCWSIDAGRRDSGSSRPTLLSPVIQTVRFPLFRPIHQRLRASARGAKATPFMQSTFSITFVALAILTGGLTPSRADFPGSTIRLPVGTIITCIACRTPRNFLPANGQCLADL